MSAEIISFASKESVERAWEALREHNARLVNDPSLLCDREFMEQQIKLDRRFRHLFMAMEPEDA